MGSVQRVRSDDEELHPHGDARQGRVAAGDRAALLPPGKLPQWIGQTVARENVRGNEETAGEQGEETESESGQRLGLKQHTTHPTDSSTPKPLAASFSFSLFACTRTLCTSIPPLFSPYMSTTLVQNIKASNELLNERSEF